MILNQNDRKNNKTKSAFSKICSEIWKEDTSPILNCGKIILIIISSPCWIPIILVILLYKILKACCKCSCRSLGYFMKNVYVKTTARILGILMVNFIYSFCNGLIFSVGGIRDFILATFHTDYRKNYNSGIYLFLKINFEIIKNLTYYNQLASSTKHILEELN